MKAKVRAVRRTPAPALTAVRRVQNTGYSNYGANLQKKSLRGWTYYGGDAKRDIEDNINTLRQRSRDAYMGVPTATAALKTLRTNTVAAGLTPTPQLDGEYLRMDVDRIAELQANIVREWNLWAKSQMCDADGLDNFYQLQQLAYLSAQMNGDAFALLQTEDAPGMPYSLRVRLIEADRVCSPNLMDVLTPTTIDGHSVHRIVQGVETDERGKVVAYWICSRHPLAAEMQDGATTWTRVQAHGDKTGRRNVLHIMQRERAGQVRGVPVLAPVLESLKQLGRYSDAELNAAVITAAYTIFIEKEAAGEAPPLGEMIPEDQLIDAADPTSIELAPGAVVDLAPGEKMNETKPSRPNANFEAFYRAVTKEISEALEIPIEVLEKNFSTSYSAARGALNEFWRTCEMQRSWFADKFCQLKVKGKGVDEVIDFGLTNKITLASTKKWGASAADIWGNLKDWKQQVSRNGFANANMVIMGKAAADAFLADATIKNMLDNRRIEIGAIKPEEMEGGLTYYGHLNLPGVDIYGYDEVYLDDETGETKPLIPDNVVLMIPSAASFMRAYGLCTYLDDAGAWHEAETDRMLRTYVEHRPDRRFIELQTHPLLIPDKIDSWLAATVL